jgi:hypothetical protein
LNRGGHALDRIPNRNSPPAYLLRETYREGHKVKKRTLANISHWPIAKIEALRGVLRGDFSGEDQGQGLSLLRSLPHGHVAGHWARYASLSSNVFCRMAGNRRA